MTSLYWIKLYHNLLNDMDFAVLPDNVWRRYVEMLLLAGFTGNNPQLPTTEKIGWHLRLQKPATLPDELARLAELGLVEQNEAGWYLPNFAEQQAPPPGRVRGSGRWVFVEDDVAEALAAAGLDDELLPDAAAPDEADAAAAAESGSDAGDQAARPEPESDPDPPAAPPEPQDAPHPQPPPDHADNSPPQNSTHRPAPNNGAGLPGTFNNSEDPDPDPDTDTDSDTDSETGTAGTRGRAPLSHITNLAYVVWTGAGMDHRISHEQRKRLNLVVGRAPPDLKRLADICRAWDGYGYNRRNVNDILACFRKGEMPESPRRKSYGSTASPQQTAVASGTEALKKEVDLDSGQTFYRDPTTGRRVTDPAG
jgi:hypothetical protein